MNTKVILEGRLGANMDVVTTQNTPFISGNIAVNNSYKGTETTTWFNITADYSRFKNMLQYLTKGKVVRVIGTLHVVPYVSKTGEKGIDLKVNADSMDFIDFGKKENSEGTATPATTVTTPSEISTGTLHSAQKPTPTPAFSEIGTNDNDLPF